MRRHRPGPLDQPGPDRRARHLRLGLPRRRPGAVGQRQAPARRRARADCPAYRYSRGDQPHRAHRYRVYHLQRPVQSGPQVRLAGLRQRWPGRLEHRHHRDQEGRTELRPGRRARPSGAIPARRRIHRHFHHAVGQLGGRRGDRRQGHGNLRGHLPDPPGGLRRGVLPGPRAAQPPALTARTAAACTGGLVAGRP